MYLKYQRSYGKVVEKTTVPLPWLAGALLKPVVWLFVRCKKLRLAFHFDYVAVAKEW